ncbi:hypothetical protein [Actinoplanes subglobosus]|uniref:Uncharacterized protein n=1 Tax=Actinoplanes subglobosus TaxID=1547892 RepID=A0ABV8J7Z1_9ACTN
MIFRWSVAVARHRRKLLVTAAVLVGLALLARLFGADPDDLAPYLGFPAFGVLVACLVVMFAPSSRRAPASFVVTGGGFRTPEIAVVPLAGTAHLGLLGIFALFPGEFLDAGAGRKLLIVIAVVMYAGYLRAQWRGFGLTLTPEGLHADKWSGSMTVPWTALDAGQPAYQEGELELAFSRPEQVGYTGVVVRKTVPVEGLGVPPEFVVAAIHHYVAHPGERTSIGTAEGHERLLAAVGVGTPPPSPSEPLTRARLLVRVPLCVVAVAAILFGDGWAMERLGEESLLSFGVHLVALTAAGTASGVVVKAVRDLWRTR